MHSKAWQQNIIYAVWQKGDIVSGYDSSQVRKDKYGSYIVFSKYGNRDSEYGWEVDHIIPQSKGGTDNLSNLQPLQWRNNLLKNNN